MDFTVQIPYSQIEVEDIALLQQAMDAEFSRLVDELYGVEE